MTLRSHLERLRRKYFSRYTIDDPRPIADTAPYTYYLPSENELLALEVGDLAKLVIRSLPPGTEWEAERMWVTITAANGDALVGRLDNIPFDMPQLKLGAAINFKRSDVVDLIWNQDRSNRPPPPAQRREFWERCMVDSCVLNGASPADYIYREEPDMAEPDDKYPDSGWRIRGTDEAIERDRMEGRSPQYVALGAVLNSDDSWLHFIDEPTGARFIRNTITGVFEPAEQD